MLLLFIYVFIALAFSFLCSVLEAVLLSISPAYVITLEEKHPKAARALRLLKADINKPLAAILTLNTIAHTTGAVGAGAQAAFVFGDNYVGVASVVLTLLILFLSEIIPKTIGALYWRKLAYPSTILLKYLTWTLYPFVWLSEKITLGLSHTQADADASRKELAAMAQVGVVDGSIAQEEFNVVENLLRLKETNIKTAMTPRTVVFSLTDSLTVETYFHKYDQTPFSRVLLYQDDPDNITGFVLRQDLLLAQARDNGKSPIKNYQRDIGALFTTTSLSQALNELVKQQSHIMLVVNEHGTMEGIITMEDLIETLLGLEITDESDTTEDMQHLAKKLWRKKAEKLGVKISPAKQKNK